MKRMLCLALTLVMALSLAIPAFAAGDTNPYGDGTDVTYTHTTKDKDGDGEEELPAPAPITETFTLIVPAAMVPGQTDEEVTAYGYWAADRALEVEADTTVTLTSDSITGSYDLAVTMDSAAATEDKAGKISTTDGANPITVTVGTPANGFTVDGSNIDNCYATAKIDVGNFADGKVPLIGEWKGTITYRASITDK